MIRRVRVSASEARRIALAAQGFDRERPAAATDARHFRRVMSTLGLLQLDFVNVLVPAHYLVIWSRLGAYDRERFDRYVYDGSAHTEQWAHEASIVPTDLWPVLAHRRAAWRPWKQNPILRMHGGEDYLSAILERVRTDGPVCAADLPPLPGPARKPGDWHRSVPRCALDTHFGRGALAVLERKPNFQRVYDLPERIVPDEHRDRRMTTEEANREMLRRSAVSLGIATRHDLADYYRMSPRDAAPRIDELVESGALQRVEVEGWTEPGYLSSGARSPRTIDGASLMSPFDPVVWYRPRAERLFDFHYRIEIYVPAERRKWGYYVLPFRMGEHIVARVDLKADRAVGTLRVQGAHEEAGVDRREVAAALAAELRSLAHWLGLETVAVNTHNAFAKELGKHAWPTKQTLPASS